MLHMLRNKLLALFIIYKLYFKAIKAYINTFKLKSKKIFFFIFSFYLKFYFSFLLLDKSPSLSCNKCIILFLVKGILVGDLLFSNSFFSV